jgi:hypothetical protein
MKVILRSRALARRLEALGTHLRIFSRLAKSGAHLRAMAVTAGPE